MYADKDATIAMRNTMFVTGDGMSLESFMLGSIMAQTKVAVESSETPEQAASVLAHYFNIAIQAVPEYWTDRTALNKEGQSDG